MFQTAIGRIHSPIKCPPRTLDMRIFLDAGGKAGFQRVWGGLAVIGDSELAWVKQVVDDLSINTDESEVKGRDLPTSSIVAAGRKIIDQERRILFWANWLPDWRDQNAQKLSGILADALKAMRPNKYHLEQKTIERWYQENVRYFFNLKPINKHKLISIIAHLQWLTTEIARTNIGHQLKSVEIVIDRENFPNEERCGIVIKSFLSAALQSSGMDCSLTGKAYREPANEGSVIVNISGESENNFGIRYVDILLQVVLRKVQPIP